MFITLTGVGSAQPPDSSEAEKLLAEVRAAWSQREAATTAIRLSWTFAEMTPKGAINHLPRREKDDGKPRPPTDATHKGKTSLLLRGLDSRYTCEKMIWSESKSDFQSIRVDSAFGRNRATTLWNFEQQKYPSGTITKAKRNAQCNELMTWAPCIAVRGTNSELMNRDGLDAFTTARRMTLEGSNVIELTQPRTELRGEIKLWVSPQSGFSAVRYEVRRPNGEVGQRVVVTPRLHPSGIWLPETWVSSVYIEKKLMNAVSATMTSAETNLGLTDENFRIEFPVGTKVEDMTGDKPIEYLVRAEGNRRMILPSEVAAKYEELAATEAGELGPTEARWIVRNWWVLAVGVVVVVLTWFRYRMTKRADRET